MLFSNLFAVVSTIAVASAQYKGFNYGSTNSDGSAKDQAQFTSEFTTAQNLIGNSGFSSARLYTMIQGGTTNTPISAIPAAIATKTTLLLGLWASAGQTIIDNEIAALTAAINQYGTPFTDLIAGISVGSEDLYRITPIGVASNAGPGAQPDVLVNYINQVRAAIAGTAASGARVGHVDTKDAWIASSNSAVISACDWLGMDGYPYYESTNQNDISNAVNLFFNGMQDIAGVAGGKEVWVTETGWPTSGPTYNQAIASVDNAKIYWDVVGCAGLFGIVNTWWFQLYDGPTAPTPVFAVVGESLTTTPLYDLSCPAKKIRRGQA